jgi:hypothetical protein
MFKASREFIKVRQPFASHPLVVVPVNKKGGREANDCFGNAADCIDRTKGIKIVSGWLVHPYNKLSDSTEIIQHYWNYSDTEQYFDETNGVPDNCEYIVDMAISNFSQDNIDKIVSNVGHSFLLTQGRFSAFHFDNTNLVLKDIPSLETKNLFEYLEKF